jgi:hypothetical protein
MFSLNKDCGPKYNMYIIFDGKIFAAFPPDTEVTEAAHGQLCNHNILAT